MPPRQWRRPARRRSRHAPPRTARTRSTGPPARSARRDRQRTGRCRQCSCGSYFPPPHGARF
nr:hypothetical protein C5F59_14785 [Streptomyces sp. QL37]